ncbi:MAG: peptidoglycan-binding protein LysM [Arachnia propionica]|nr:MAG: peptidoglycan-binding protein LysM [Arachnia propionica]
MPDNIAVLPAAKQTALSSSARTGDSPVEPTLLLLGPVDLVGTRGRPPSRARKQCIEYCAWLHTHPAARPTEMVADLLVAETTRRSNMSRLRSWLGESPEGHQYLPDAYSGVIDLAPEVTSDWERLQSLISGGVRSASTASLIEALGMVRGEPLAQVWFQWGWAAQLRTDMLSLIADVAAVLADRYLSLGDAAGAIWAVQQGQLATGPDEILASRRIEALALAGEATKLERAVRDLTRQAKAEGRDLSAETTRRVQRALSSQLRRTGS